MEDGGTDYRKKCIDPSPLLWQAATRVALQVAVQERNIRHQVRAASGKWNPKEVVRELPYGQVVTLGLTARIVAKAGAEEKNAHLLVDGSGHERPSTNR